jgi:hypothetical protein
MPETHWLLLTFHISAMASFSDLSIFAHTSTVISSLTPPAPITASSLKAYIVQELTERQLTHLH